MKLSSPCTIATPGDWFGHGSIDAVHLPVHQPSATVGQVIAISAQAVTFRLLLFQSPCQRWNVTVGRSVARVSLGAAHAGPLAASIRALTVKSKKPLVPAFHARDMFLFTGESRG